MKKQGTERRVYTDEFKAEAVAPAEKCDKPVPDRLKGKRSLGHAAVRTQASSPMSHASP